jgi:long-chain acyl-CoA synthetase
VSPRDSHVPASLSPYPDKTLVDYLRESASAAPGDPAIFFKGGCLSFKDLDTLSDRFAISLRSFGVKPGDRIALVLPNCPQFLIAEFGAWKAGAAIMPLSPLYAGEELIEPLKSAGARLVVTLTPFYQRVKDVQAQTNVGHVIATGIKEYLPPALRVLFTLLKEKKDGHRIRLQAGDVWFQDCVKSDERKRGGGAPRSESLGAGRGAPATSNDNAVMLLSGGTTGTPKAVVGKHRDLVAAGLQLQAWLRPGPPEGPPKGGHYVPGEEQHDIALLPLPLFHVYGCVGVQSHAVVSRTPLALIPNPRDLDDVLKTIERVKPTLFSAVPALFIALLNHPRVQARKVDFSSIRACFSGAAPLLAATKARFEELSGGRIVEGYSLTEAMMACVVNPLGGASKIGSVGLPLPDVEVAIVDPESGERFLPRGETGEVLLRGPQVMSGYWNNPGETSRTLRRHDAGGPWLHTGDLGYLDPDSYLFIVDRQKDLIKTSGYQVWPREVEEVLALHPCVMDVGVAGIADDAKGEVVKAWVVRRPGTSVTSDELRSHCRAKLAPYKVPAQIEFRDSLPKTLTGKVLRRALSGTSASTRS